MVMNANIIIIYSIGGDGTHVISILLIIVVIISDKRFGVVSVPP